MSDDEGGPPDRRLWVERNEVRDLRPVCPLTMSMRGGGDKLCAGLGASYYQATAAGDPYVASRVFTQQKKYEVFQ